MSKTESLITDVRTTIEIGSQRGPAYDNRHRSFADVVNDFLDRGWRILSNYVEGDASQGRQ